MRQEYDFSEGKRRPVRSPRGKTRISIHVDTAVMDAFRAPAEKQGTSYQTLMNQALRDLVPRTRARSKS
jgi:uncharacterized protein (DUF4415 family)